MTNGWPCNQCEAVNDWKLVRCEVCGGATTQAMSCEGSRHDLKTAQERSRLVTLVWAIAAVAVSVLAIIAFTPGVVT